MHVLNLHVFICELFKLEFFLLQGVDDYENKWFELKKSKLIL